MQTFVISERHRDPFTVEAENRGSAALIGARRLNPEYRLVVSKHITGDRYQPMLGRGVKAPVPIGAEFTVTAV